MPNKHSNGELTFSPGSLALAKAIHARPSQFTLLLCLFGIPIL
ncbi:Uncharacterised protein [Mycobacteroides abscessus subsp. abscessus]|nr:Uncharacterised protein [Mycobacteroides abscessus subsp. abscessus]